MSKREISPQKIKKSRSRIGAARYLDDGPEIEGIPGCAISGEPKSIIKRDAEERDAGRV